MIEVNRAKRSPSNIRKSRKIMVAGGEYAGQAWNSLAANRTNNRTQQKACIGQVIETDLKWVRFTGIMATNH